MGQGQPREIIWTILVVLTYTMLHTKFQGHQSIGSEEDFLRFLPYMGMVAIVVKWPGLFKQLFVPSIPGGYIWNLVTIGPVVSEKKSFEIVDGRRRTTEPAYTISFPGAFGSGELKNLSWALFKAFFFNMNLHDTCFCWPIPSNIILSFFLTIFILHHTYWKDVILYCFYTM